MWQALWNRSGDDCRCIQVGGGLRSDWSIYVCESLWGERSSRISRYLFKMSVIAYCLGKLAALFIVICSLCWFGMMFFQHLVITLECLCIKEQALQPRQRLCLSFGLNALQLFEHELFFFFYLNANLWMMGFFIPASLSVTTKDNNRAFPAVFSFGAVT